MSQYISPLTACPDYIPVFIFYYHITYHHMLRIKRDFNQQDLNTANFHFDKSE